MSRNRKILVGTGLVLLIGALTFQALRADRGNATEVRAEAVERRNLVSLVSATGHIEPKSSVDISADISGRIVQLPVEEGEEVAEGDLLLVIDPTQYEAAVRRARAQLSEARSRQAQARADYQQENRDWERLRTLKERTPDLVTDQETEQARTRSDVQLSNLQATEHAVEQAEASLAEAEDRLARTIIRAPMDGRVTRRNVERGETAIVGTMNNPGSLLLTVADLSVMEARIEVDETDIPLVQIGDSASVAIDAFPDRAFSGRVTRISHSSLRPRDQTSPTGASEEAVDFEVRITLDDPPEGIRSDLSVTTDIVTSQRTEVLAVPIIALTLMRRGDLRADDGSAGTEAGDGARASPSESNAGEDDDEAIEGVFVIEDGTARFRPVEVGVAGNSYFEVVGGLSEGDSIVSGSYQAIRDLADGARVEVSGGTS